MLYVMNTITFENWLKQMLEERRMSQSDLAREADIGKSSISDIMTGRRKVGKDVAIRIARALGIPRDQVFRAAGFLEGNTKNDEKVEQILYAINTLSQEEKDEVLSYIRWRINNRKT